MGCWESLSSPRWARSFCFLCFGKFSPFAPALVIAPGSKGTGCPPRHQDDQGVLTCDHGDFLRRVSNCSSVPRPGTPPSVHVPNVSRCANPNRYFHKHRAAVREVAIILKRDRL